MKPIILFQFIFFVFCRLNNTYATNQLNICVVYEKEVATRETKVNLKSFRLTTKLSNEIIKKDIKQDIQNGECFALSVIDNDNDSEIKMIALVFEIYVKPLPNEYHDQLLMQGDNPPDNAGDDDDHLPYENEHYEIRVDDIRTMVRPISLTLYEPNFAKRYTFNLGIIDPPDFYWNRRFLAETYNDFGTFHVLLFAYALKHQRNSNELISEYIFLGYDQIQQTAAADGGPASNSLQQITSEYKLSIPIKAAQLFKHQILNVHLEIYNYEKHVNDHAKNNELSENEGDETTECPICFETLNNERLTMKLHEDYHHVFHRDCLIKWIEAQQQIRCPICNRTATLILASDLQPIFGVRDQFAQIFSMHPLARLYKIAHGLIEEDQFKRNQAKIVIKTIEDFLDSYESQLKQLFLEGFNLTINNNIANADVVQQKLFKIGPDGLEEHQMIQQIQIQLNNAIDPENPTTIVFEARRLFSLINGIRKFKTYAHADLQNIQFISEN